MPGYLNLFPKYIYIVTHDLNNIMAVKLLNYLCIAACTCGGWTSWVCDAACGQQGTQRRSRTCDNRNNCTNQILTESSGCTGQPCGKCTK